MNPYRQHFNNGELVKIKVSTHEHHIGKLALVIGKSNNNPEMAYAVHVLETGRRDSYHYSRLEKL